MTDISSSAHIPLELIEDILIKFNQDKQTASLVLVNRKSHYKKILIQQKFSRVLHRSPIDKGPCLNHDCSRKRLCTITIFNPKFYDNFCQPYCSSCIKKYNFVKIKCFLKELESKKNKIAKPKKF